MSYTIPPNNRGDQDPGHLSDHANISDMLTLMSGAINVKRSPYNATGDGNTDDTNAIQSAINAAIASGGSGAVYFPAGSYKYTTLSASGSDTNSLTFIGDNSNYGSPIAQASVLKCSTAAAGTHSIYVNDLRHFTMLDVSILGSATPANYTDDVVGLYVYSTAHTFLYRCNVASLGSGRFNTGIKLVDTGEHANIIDCNVYGGLHSVWVNGGKIVKIRDCELRADYGTGQSKGNLYVDGEFYTMHVSNTLTYMCDIAIQVTGGGTNDYPSYFFVQDVEINNPKIGGVLLESGSRFWADQLWMSDASLPDNEYPSCAFRTGSNYKGTVCLTNSHVQNWRGHGIDLQGGQGFQFIGCQFGHMGAYAANTYDDIHIGANINNVTIDGCQFDLPHASGLDSPVARSAIYVEDGATNLVATGNSAVSSGYGTAAVIDLSGNLVMKGNENLIPDSISAAPNTTVTATSYADLTSTFTIPAYGHRVGGQWLFRAWGHGTQNATARTLSLRMCIDGNGIGAFTARTGPTNGENFGWEYKGYIACRTTGSTGADPMMDDFSWGSTTAESRTYHTLSGHTDNTTTAHTYHIEAQWSDVGSSITCDGCELVRIPA